MPLRDALPTALTRQALVIVGLLVLAPLPVSAQAASNYVPLGSSAINDISVAWFFDTAKNQVVACAFTVPTGYPGPQFQPINIKCGSTVYDVAPTPPTPVVPKDGDK